LKGRKQLQFGGSELRLQIFHRFEMILKEVDCIFFLFVQKLILRLQTFNLFLVLLLVQSIVFGFRLLSWIAPLFRILRSQGMNRLDFAFLFFGKGFVVSELFSGIILPSLEIFAFCFA